MAVKSPAVIRRAPPSAASHASKRQSCSASDPPETSSGAPCSVRWRNSTRGAPARRSNRRVTREEGRRTAPAAPTILTTLARVAASKTKGSLAWVPLVSWSSAGRPRDASVRR
eukprot:2311787-Prymnesium_polylepis.2